MYNVKILLTGAWTCKPEYYAMVGEKGVNGDVTELFLVVSLKSIHRLTKLCGEIGVKGSEGGRNAGFHA